MSVSGLGEGPQVNKQETLQHYEVGAWIYSENDDIIISSTISSCKNNVAIMTKPNDGDNYYKCLCN